MRVISRSLRLRTTRRGIRNALWSRRTPGTSIPRVGSPTRTPLRIQTRTLPTTPGRRRTRSPSRSICCRSRRLADRQRSRSAAYPRTRNSSYSCRDRRHPTWAGGSNSRSRPRRRLRKAPGRRSRCRSPCSGTWSPQRGNLKTSNRSQRGPKQPKSWKASWAKCITTLA